MNFKYLSPFRFEHFKISSTSKGVCIQFPAYNEYIFVNENIFA